MKIFQNFSQTTTHSGNVYYIKLLIVIFFFHKNKTFLIFQIFIIKGD